MSRAYPREVWIARFAMTLAYLSNDPQVASYLELGNTTFSTQQDVDPDKAARAVYLSRRSDESTGISLPRRMSERLWSQFFAMHLLGLGSQVEPDTLYNRGAELWHTYGDLDPEEAADAEWAVR